MHSLWLAEPKFLPPAPPGGIVPRADLLGTLGQAIRTQRLGLLSAAAGYGKTTLLASLPPQMPGLPFAWFTVDHEDNDPVRFLLGILAAAEQLFISETTVKSHVAHIMNKLGVSSRIEIVARARSLNPVSAYQCSSRTENDPQERLSNTIREPALRRLPDIQLNR